NYAKERGWVIAMSGFGTGRPAQRKLHGAARLGFGGGIRRAFVEDHHYIRTQIPLHLHGGFRVEEHLAAVNGRLKRHTFFGDLAQFAEAKHLKTTGIREYGTGPLHKVVQVTVGFDHLSTWAQH